MTATRMQRSSHVPAVGLRMPATMLGFVYWFMYAVQILLTALFFRDYPKMGTAVNNALSMLFLYGLVLLIFSGAVAFRRTKMGYGFGAVCVFVSWSGLSLIWTAASPRTSVVAYWITMVADLATVWLLMHIGEVREMALRCIQGFVVGTLVTLSTVYAIGMRDDIGRLGDVQFLHPNALGSRVAVAALFSIYLMTRIARDNRTRIPWAIAGCILALGLGAALSKTAIAAFVGASAVFLLKGRIGAVRKGALICTAVVAATISSGFLAESWDNYLAGNAGKNLDTLTGRTDIWDASWAMIKASPVHGYGYFSFRDIGPQIAEVRLVHAHNEALNILFNYGVVGLVISVATYGLLFLAMMRANRGSRLNPDDGFGALGLALLTYALLRGITEAETTGLLFPLAWMIVFFAWGARARADRQIAHEKGVQRG